MREPSNCAYLGRESAFQTNTVTEVDCAHVFVVHTPQLGLRAFLVETPHLAHEGLVWDAKTGTFYSPAHGERFAIDGGVLDGPAQRPLWECPLARRGSEVWVAGSPDADRDEIRQECMGAGGAAG
jgi:Rieske Fe-S protein